MKRPTNSAGMLGTVGAREGGALLLLAGVALGMAGTMEGCGSGSKSEGRALAADEFRVAPAPGSSGASTAKAEAPGAAVKADAGNAAGGEGAKAEVVKTDAAAPVAGGAAGSRRLVPVAGTGGERAVVAVAGEPPKGESDAKPVKRDVLADCMVGQIQGRPVFASEILDPLSGELRNAAASATTAPAVKAWVGQAAQLIRRSVELRVRDELLLGEARARLTPEQKMGLIYFLKRIDQWQSGQSGGSRAQAEEQIQAKTGETYDQFLQAERDKTLIRELIRENVSPYVRVPWRKVERYYKDNQGQINPPPYAVVRIIMVSGDNAASVAKVEAAARAADDAEYHALAASPVNEFRATDRVTGKDVRDGLMIRALDKAAYEQLEWVGNPAWNAAAAKLKPGEAAGPIDAGTYKVFIRREADVVSSFRSLEDAELQIVTGLTMSKEAQEQNEFFMQLLGKGSFTPVGRMTRELLVLAAQRHLSPEIAAAVRDQNPLGPDTGLGLERSPAPPVIDDMSLNPPVKKPKPASGSGVTEPK